MQSVPFIHLLYPKPAGTSSPPALTARTTWWQNMSIPKQAGTRLVLPAHTYKVAIRPGISHISGRLFVLLVIQGSGRPNDDIVYAPSYALRLHY